jgi:DNA polymerase III delta prime subunit
MNYGDDILGYLNKKRVVKQWLKEKYKTKPLIIYGQSGTGKTKLAEYISKDYIPIIIDIEFCKKKTMS